MAINPLQQQQPLLDKLGAPVVAQDPQEQDINDLNIGGPVNFQQKIAAQQAAAAQQSAPSRPRPGEVAAGVDPNAPVTPLPSGGIPVSAPAQPPSNQEEFQILVLDFKHKQQHRQAALMLRKVRIF